MAVNQPKVQYACAADVEAAFYAAFGRCDLQAMQAVWARNDVICVHPGSEPIQGYEAVVRSWRLIFAGAERPLVRTRIIGRIVRDDVVVHMLEEHISAPGEAGQGAVVFATNIYRREEQGWRMAAHHASPLPPRSVQTRTLQ